MSPVYQPGDGLPFGAGRRVAAILLALIVITGAAITASIRAAADLAADDQPRRLSIFAPQATYSVALKVRDNIDYVPLIDLLEPLGALTATQGKNHDWQLKLNGIDGQFSEGKTQAHVRGTTFDLASPLIADNGRPYVPIKSVFYVLYNFTRSRIDLHEAGRRIFIDNTATRFTVDAQKNPGTVVLSFAAPVNPSVHTDGNAVRLLFRREPVISDAPALALADKVITSLNFGESNGSAEITVQGAVPLTASFSDGGRTITLTAIAAQATAAPNATAPATPQTTPATASAGAAPPANLPRPGPTAPHFLVVIDPGHGGSERGAALGVHLAEKDVTLALARRLRSDLQAHGIAAVVLRDSDADLSLEQRAIAANQLHPALYINLHAGSPGRGIRIYTSLLTMSQEPRPATFLPWDTAQASFLARSQGYAGSIAEYASKRSMAVLVLPAALGPLNRIAAPAISVEMTAPAAEADSLAANAMHQSVSAVIVAGVLNARARSDEMH